MAARPDFAVIGRPPGFMAYEPMGCGHGKDHHGERVPRRRPGRGVARARAAVDRGEPPGSRARRHEALRGEILVSRAARDMLEPGHT